MADAIAQRGVLELPGLRQLLLLVGLAGAIAAALWLVFWSQGQNYTTLYSQLSERETAQVVDALQTAGIPHTVETHVKEHGSLDPAKNWWRRIAIVVLAIPPAKVVAAIAMAVFALPTAITSGVRVLGDARKKRSRQEGDKYDEDSHVLFS